MTQNQGEMDSSVGGEIIPIAVQNYWCYESFILQHSREPERGQTLCSIQAGGEVKLGPTFEQLKLSRRTDGEVGPWQTRCSDGSRRPVPPEQERDGHTDLTRELSFDGGQESFKKGLPGSPMAGSLYVT